MLKNKFKIIAILTIIILAITFPVVRAENETTDDSSNTANLEIEGDEISTENSETTNIESNESTISDEDFKKGDVYLSGDNVTIDYIIDGNLFVIANNVTINSQIGGDAFICANTVTVEKNGYIFSNLFTFSKNVIINGVVYDLYAASENTTINGYVYRDIRVGSDTVNIFGAVGRNAFVSCSNINFMSNIDSSNVEQTEEESDSTTSPYGIINGNLSYSSKQEASIPEGCVTGEVSFSKESTSSSNNTLQIHIISLGSFLATIIVIWLLCLWLRPNFLKNTDAFLTTKKILPVIGIGILTPIVAIFLSIILLILGITSTLGLLLLTLLFVLIAISTSIFVITLNNIICNKLKIQKTIGILGMLILSSAVIWLIGLIPYIGPIVEIVAIILGLGIFILYLKNGSISTVPTAKEE